MKMADMKRSKADKKADSVVSAVPTGEYEGPDYPYGLCINLEKDSLEKLGLSKLPEVGEEMIIQAQVKVTRVSASADQKNEHKGVELQIVKMGISGGEEKSAAEKIYGS
jgi:hypothetical protein